MNAPDPESGEIVAAIAVPANAGTAFDGKHLLRIADTVIQKIHPGTGAVLRTIESDRFVTGVTWVDGELWHGTWEGELSELRRVEPRTGRVLETLDVPPGVGVSGAESDGGDTFFCGGGNSGRLRTVRRPR